MKPHNLFYISLLFILAISLSAVENLIKNEKFALDAVTGKMKDWSVGTIKVKTDRKPCLFQDKTAILTLERGEQMVALIQRKVQLIPERSYCLTFEARSTTGTILSSYFEWILKDGKYVSTKSYRNKLTSEWKKYSFKFQAPARNTSFKTPPYLAFTVKTPGKVEIRRPVLSEIAIYARIDNANFEKKESGAWLFGKNSRILPSGGHFSPGVLCLGEKGAYASLKIVLEPGKNYKLSYYVTGRKNTETTNGFSEYLCNMTLNGKTVAGGMPKQDCFQNNWQKKSQIIHVRGKHNGVLKLTLTSCSCGEILFDDFEIYEVNLKAEKAFKVLLSSPAFRNMIFSSNPIQEIRGKIQSSQSIKTFTVKFNGKTATIVAGQDFVFSAKNLRTGKHLLIVEAVDPNGKKIIENIIIEKLPLASHEVVFNNKKQLLVNGKPYLIVQNGGIGLPYVPKSPAAVYCMRRTGMLASFTPNYSHSNLKEKLDECHRVGIKTSWRLGAVTMYMRAGNLKNFKKEWQKVLDKLRVFKQHPALLYYYPFDECIWNGVPLEVVEYIYQSLKEMDPYHPVFCVEAPRGTPDVWRPYAEYCDAFGIDIYPIPVEAKHSELSERGPRSVGLYTLLSAQTVNNQKPVYMVLQAFDWGNISPIHKSFHRFPTREEFRFMNFDALLHGASAFSYYRHNNTDAEVEYYMYLEQNLFYRFGYIVLNGQKIQQKIDTSENVMSQVWEYQGNRYIVVLNRGDNYGYVSLPAGQPWFQLDPNSNIPMKQSKIKLPQTSCRIFSTAKNLPLGDTIPVDPEKEKILMQYFNYICRILRTMLPETKWIWAADDTKNLRCRAVRKVIIAKPVKKAILKMTVDDEFICWLDGKKICTGDDWHYYAASDISKDLTVGMHIIALEAINQGGPCAIAGNLIIEYKDGTKEKIVTDSSWLATAKDVPAQWKQKGLPATLKVRELAPLGKGPWKL